MSPRRARSLTGSGDPAAELRERLVAAAAALVAERPAGAITTREIARSAGLSHGVLYNYFADKNELIVAGMVRYVESALAVPGTDLPVPGEATVEANLVRYAEALHGLVLGSFPLIAGLVPDPELLHRVVREIHRPGQGILPFLDRIGEYLAGEQQLGRIAADTDLPAAMLLLTGASATLTAGAHLRPGTAPPDGDAERIAAVVRVLVTGLR